MRYMVSSLLSVATPPTALGVKQYHSLIPNSNEVDDGDFKLQLDHALCLVLGAAFLGVFVMIAGLILKLLVNLMKSGVEQGVVIDETASLLPKHVISFNYGTCDDDQGDGEYGKGNNCSGSSSSSSHELYDKICVICYDEQKCCFFIPCGHSVTCETCAKRIIVGENKSCPICRRLIHRVRKFFMA